MKDYTWQDWMLIAATIMIPIVGGVWIYSKPSLKSLDITIGFGLIIAVIIIILRWTGVMGKSPAQSTSLSLLQQDVQKYMEEVLDDCTMKKLWWKNQEGTVYIEIPECYDNNYPSEVTRAYSRCLDSIVVKWVNYTETQPSSNMTWDKLKSEIIKCVPQHDCNPICYTGEPIPPPPL